ncbi:SHOCT domain-containing protein [Rhizobium sp. PP-CC-3G-465]|uniref:SHOCT domain-containing protein n=1 Tax=Rhizobium sp. PP-CC-3G-465 TaxID=2135648 RepID=UPI0010452862|nr:putative oligomerization/nucleic acid binding protein [Rhizobium sp. PP-CC-3G-465]
MGKLVIGSFTFVAGLFLCFTGVGALIGIPMIAGGLAMGVAGMGSMGVTAVKTGMSTGKLVRDMRNGRETTTLVTEDTTTASGSVADEIGKLASLLAAGHLTQDEFDRKKAQLLGLAA